VDVQLPTDEDSDDHECYCDIVAAAPPARSSLNGADPPQYATPVAPCCPNNDDVDTDNMSEGGGDDTEELSTLEEMAGKLHFLLGGNEQYQFPRM
jgi:hypothetical protein